MSGIHAPRWQRPINVAGSKRQSGGGVADNNLLTLHPGPRIL